MGFEFPDCSPHIRILPVWGWSCELFHEIVGYFLLQEWLFPPKMIGWLGSPRFLLPERRCMVLHIFPEFFLWEKDSTSLRHICSRLSFIWRSTSSSNWPTAGSDGLAVRFSSRCFMRSRMAGVKPGVYSGIFPLGMFLAPALNKMRLINLLSFLR